MEIGNELRYPVKHLPRYTIWDSINESVDTAVWKLVWDSVRWSIFIFSPVVAPICASVMEKDKAK